MPKRAWVAPQFQEVPKGKIMPLYEYICKNCNHKYEKIQKYTSPEDTDCPKCNGPVHRPIAGAALIFRGSGWYCNDYPKSS